MPPPMPNPSKRITANPIRPARYRPGKAVPEEESSDDDSDQEEVEAKPAVRKPQSSTQRQKPSVPTHQADEDDDEEGFVTDEDEEDIQKTTASKASVPISSIRNTQSVSQLQAPSRLSITKDDSEAEASADSSEEEDEEESEDESSSEDEPQRKFQRPTFIKKTERQKPIEQNASPGQTESPAPIAAATSTPDVDEQARRLAQAELYIKDRLEKDAIARAQGKKAWDDDEELAPEDTVDDTDGLDPEAEHAAWRLRELKRLKRDREAIEAREKEIEELERRRNLTQEERDAEDREYLDKQKEEREEGRGKANYMAKYHHKGAFFQDDEMAEILKKRDIMGARFEDDTDKSVLPEYMRVRDMTKLGKKGRTRYTDLKGEDTGRFGESVKRWRGAGYQNDRGDDGQNLRGVDERFLPDRDRDSRGPTGANASAVGQRRERKYSKSRSRSRSPRRRRDDSRDRGRGDTYRPRRRSHSYSRSRSRSRTPPRKRRSPSPYNDREKRRRVEID